jgi:hypothetical protein
MSAAGRAHSPAVYGPDSMRPRATVRNSARSGQLVGKQEADARDVLDHAGADLDQALSDHVQIPNPVSLFRMTPAERLDEIAELLAAGLMSKR